MRKVSIFVCLLLAVVAAEVGVLLYDGFRPRQPNISTNIREIVLSEANAQVPAANATEEEDNRPLFEKHSAEDIESQLDEIETSLKTAEWIQQINDEAEPLVAEADKVAEGVVVAEEPVKVEEPVVQAEEVIEEVVEEPVVQEEVVAEPEVQEEVAAEEVIINPATESVAVEEAAVAAVVEEPAAEEVVEEVVAAEEPVNVEEVTTVAVVEEPVVQEEKPVAVVDDSDKALVAVVIDDVGLSVPFGRELAKFGKPLTVSLLPYGASNKKQAEMLRESGFEVMLHIPMMPHVPANLAPVTLSPEMDKKEIQDDLKVMLARFEGAGITSANNHMGSLFTEKEQGMRYVMEFLKSNGLYFMDSKTTAKSVGKKVAAEYGVPFIERDVFLDNERDYNYIMGQFRKLENVAKKKGYAVAIGHPYGQTLKALNDWAKGAEERGIKLVTTSDLLGRKNKR